MKEQWPGRIQYDLLAAEYARHRRVHPEVLRKLLERIAPDGVSRVVEIGCGTGNYINAVETTTRSRCCGVDPSEKMLDAARAKNPSIVFKLGRGEQLPLENDTFDLAYSVDVIHHVTSPADFFHETRRVLKSGGLVCTVTESESMIRRRIHSHYFPETIAVELRRYPTLSTLTTLMQQAGFTGITEQPVEFPYQVTDLQPYRDKAFSSLLYVTDAAFHRGITQMEQDLSQAPLQAVNSAALVWGMKR